MSAPQSPWPEWSMTEFSDLDSYGGEYKPEASFRVGIETLTDGPYDLEIMSATWDKTNSAQRICRLGLKVIGVGRTVEWSHWLTEQKSVNNFAANLAALGFDAHLWNTPGRPLSKEIPAAVAKLPGIKFRAMKTSREDSRPTHKGKIYHDLQINGRIEGRPMPSLTPPSQTPTAAAFNGIPAPVGGGAGAFPDEIPF